ncbi:MAG: hypothetical protein GY699_22940 [Desulfobacteraceae bacterium]|nr:hypothetical protein [Desulfobacteraceae bacterium]
MIPWEEIDRAKVPGDNGDVVLRKRGTEFSIRTVETELMNSRVHGSEDALAQLTIERIKQKPGMQLLIGGLGMGYTLAAALGQLNSDAHITVSELIPAVIKWNQKYLGHLAGMPLNDPRVSIKQEDVTQTIKRGKSTWDAILLDVDNGPKGLTREANNALYSTAGLKTSFLSLCPGGILSVWSSNPDEKFTHRLKQCGFNPQTKTVRARKSGKGSKHIIWLAKKP